VCNSVPTDHKENLASTDPKGEGSASPDPLGVGPAASNHQGNGSASFDPGGMRSVLPDPSKTVPPRLTWGLRGRPQARARAPTRASPPRTATIMGCGPKTMPLTLGRGGRISTPRSPDTLTQGSSIAFPYGLRNTAQIVEHHMVRRFCPPPINDKFVGMADYIVKSIHDLLASNSESISDSASSQGTYHPSRECFMAEITNGAHREVTPKGPITNAHDGTPHGGNGTPRCPADGRGAVSDAKVPPHPRMNQLRERP
jgi:hypothetical protein